jgi:hypothetical protein
MHLHLSENRLACQSRLVENGKAAGNPSIDWNHIAASDEKTVSGTNGIERHLLQCSIPMPERGSGHAGEEGRHLPTSVALGKAFELLAARIHPCDDHRRLSLIPSRRPDTLRRQIVSGTGPLL